VAPGDGDAPRVTLTLADGSVTRADFVVLAGGLRFDVQPIEGFDALWGERLFHCPFCHGWEVAGQRLAAIAPAEMVEHYAPLIGVWSDDTTPVDQGDVERVWLDGDEVVVVRRSGGVLRVDALFAPPILRAHDDLPEQLGLERAVLNPLMQHAVGVVTDPLDGSTPVPGVFAAGDLTGANPAVAIAVQSGQAAAVGIVRQYAAARAAAAH
jgi:thioredoxin reductase